MIVAQLSFEIAGSAALCATLILGSTVALAEPTNIYAQDGLSAVFHDECDATPFVVVTLDAAHDVARYADHEKFGELVAPHLNPILNAAKAWLVAPENGDCAEDLALETLTLVGVVNALSVYASAATADSAWAANTGVPDARSLSAFAAALPAASPGRCATFTQTVAPEVAKMRTKLFTARAAHTTGQWSDKQALEALAPLHARIMDAVGEWGFDWHCPEVFALTKLAVLADLERETLLKEAETDIVAAITAASTPEEEVAVMTTMYRLEGYEPIAQFDQLVKDINGQPTIRYGGYSHPVVERLEATLAN